MYYTYMIRCEDNSLYTGMTNNLKKRIYEHISKNGAKYTESHSVMKIEAAWKSKDKSLACNVSKYELNFLNPVILLVNPPIASVRGWAIFIIALNPLTIELFY